MLRLGATGELGLGHRDFLVTLGQRHLKDILNRWIKRSQAELAWAVKVGSAARGPGSIEADPGTDL